MDLVSAQSRWDPLQCCRCLFEVVLCDPEHIFESRYSLSAVVGVMLRIRSCLTEYRGRYDQWLSEGLSATTVHNYHAIISATLHQAVRWGWVEHASTDRVKAPRPVRKELVTPTPQQLSALVKTAEEYDPLLAIAIALAALTGCRRGELIALRWSDVDFERQQVTISRSLTLTRGEQGRAIYHKGPTKTHQVRIVALDDLAVQVLKRRYTHMVDLSNRAESELVDDPFVLSHNANGGVPASPDNLTHAFTALCEKMERPALEKLRKTKPTAARKDLPATQRWPFRLHDLRHFHATQLIGAGVNVRTVSERLGHADASMTLRVYAHALPQKDREAAAVIGGVLGALRV
ncbi:site-specific integrase [Saccharomonospora sp.]|uniref:tyrosine-type recombinase/integrase n=1 Tax=Saccharomonospora sp. TaxID=33913 RepID=UPI002625E38A|nr:site-specific integrase [Saccharomonospora sp.]